MGIYFSIYQYPIPCPAMRIIDVPDTVEDRSKQCCRQANFESYPANNQI